jgi:hypothetical protein
MIQPSVFAKDLLFLCYWSSGRCATRRQRSTTYNRIKGRNEGATEDASLAISSSAVSCSRFLPPIAPELPTHSAGAATAL